MIHKAKLSAFVRYDVGLVNRWQEFAKSFKGEAGHWRLYRPGQIGAEFLILQFRKDHILEDFLWEKLQELENLVHFYFPSPVRVRLTCNVPFYVEADTPISSCVDLPPLAAGRSKEILEICERNDLSAWLDLIASKSMMAERWRLVASGSGATQHENIVRLSLALSELKLVRKIESFACIYDAEKPASRPTALSR